MQRRFAIILGGGRSARMGRDKRALVLDGRTLLALAVDACAARDLTVTVTPDLPEDVPAGRVTCTLEDPPFGGPVAGIAAGLAALPPALPGDEVLLLACDLPRVADIVAVLDAAPLAESVEGPPVEPAEAPLVELAETPLVELVETTPPPTVSTSSTSETAPPLTSPDSTDETAPSVVSTSSTDETAQSVTSPDSTGETAPSVVSTGSTSVERPSVDGDQDAGGERVEASEPAGRDGVCLLDAEDYPQYLAARYRRSALEARLRAVGDPRAQSVRRLMTGLELRRIPAPGITTDVDTPDEAAAAGVH